MVKIRRIAVVILRTERFGTPNLPYYRFVWIRMEHKCIGAFLLFTSWLVFMYHFGVQIHALV